MTARTIVVDTNVWIDYLLGYRSLHEDAKRFVMEAVRQEIPLVIPSHSMNDVFFLIQQQLKAANRKDGALALEAAAECARRSAWASIDVIMELATVGPSDLADARIASKYRNLHPDYEDNLVVACAMRLGARLLVTNDQTLIRRSPVATVSAHDAYELITV